MRQRKININGIEHVSSGRAYWLMKEDKLRESIADLEYGIENHAPRRSQTKDAWLRCVNKRDADQGYTCCSPHADLVVALESLAAYIMEGSRA